MKKIVLFFISSLLFVGCGYYTRVNLREWNPESENVTNLKLLYEGEGREISPVLLGDKIIFESDKNDNSNLWMINLDNPGGISKLTSYNGPDKKPCPFPNDTNYIFLSNRGKKGYYLGDIHSPLATTIASCEKPDFGGWCRGDVSPDGKKLLYVSGKYIWTYNLETNRKTQYVRGTEPRWSPDGKYIIYRKICLNEKTFLSTSIWRMTSKGTRQTEILSGSDKFSYSGASISPNNKKIVFEKRKIYKSLGGEYKFANSDIWICNVDGTNPTQITTNPLPETDPFWIDNNRIIFSSNRPQSGEISDKKWDLWILSLPENL